MNPFIYGKTAKCCVCYSIATNWSGWLRKSRDGIVAGFCEAHKPNEKVYTTFGSHNLRGIFNKEMVEVEPPKSKRMTTETVTKKFGLNINVIEQ